MAETKKITIDWSESGADVYAMVRRELDGYLLDDATGDFAAAPADPCVGLAEDGVIKGRYEAVEDRSAWDDGRYTVAVYKQSGPAPSPASDTIIGSGEMAVRDDREVYLDSMPSFVHDWIVNRLEVSDNGDGTETITLYGDDDVTALKTWTWDGAAKTRSRAV